MKTIVQSKTLAQSKAIMCSKSEQTSPRTDTTPTAANLVTDLDSDVTIVGTSWSMCYINTNGTHTNTIAVGTGCTLYGTTTIPALTSAIFTFRITNITGSSESYDLYIN